ncbi:hypothetical protein SUDANB95_05526 [Actinosynnema sp. ALI-1.44]
MVNTNQNSNQLDQIRELRREVAELRKNVGLSSAVLRRGGLTFLDDAFLRMLDDLGVEILYLGPDGSGKQMVRLRREGGADILFTYAAVNGVQFWALTDAISNIIMSDDAVAEQGIARPSLGIPTRTVRWDQLPSSDGATFEQVEDTGFFFKQQPYCHVQVVHCSTASGTTGEARLMLDGVQVGSTIAVGFAVSFASATFPVAGTHMSQHRLTLECRRTAGTGRVGASMVVRGEQS